MLPPQLIDKLEKEQVLTHTLTMPKEDAGVEGALAGGFYMGLCQLTYLLTYTHTYVRT